MKSMLAFIESLPLNKKEKEYVKKFKEKPQSHLFVRVAEILKSYRHHQESIEVLAWGVEKYPYFIAARVQLAHELLQRGLVEEAWKKLQASPNSLGQNTLAQKIMLKTAVLLDYEAFARAIYEYIAHHDMLDVSCAKIGSLLKNKGLWAAQSYIRDNLRQEGIVPIEFAKNKNEKKSQRPTMIVPPHSFEPITIADPTIQSCTVASLDEVFHKSKMESKQDQDLLKLDEISKAEFLFTSKQYSAAMRVYRRLAQEAPQNDYYRNRLRESAELAKQQRVNDLAIDPKVVDKIDDIDHINQQINYLQTLMTRL